MLLDGLEKYKDQKIDLTAEELILFLVANADAYLYAADKESDNDTAHKFTEMIFLAVEFFVNFPEESKSSIKSSREILKKMAAEVEKAQKDTLQN